MMKLFVDTNIFVNWLVSTNSGHDESAQLIKKCMLGQAFGYVSSHSLTDLFYITRKYFSIDDRISFLRLILDRFVLIPENFTMFSTVLNDPSCRDLEDGLQMQCARTEQVDFIVTENLKDFQNSEVKALSAKQILSVM